MPPSLSRELDSAIASTEAFTLPLGKVATRFGKHTNSVARWITRGVRRGNRQIKLRAIRVGRNWHTSEAAVREFLAECNAAERGEPSPKAQAIDRETREFFAARGITY